MDKFDHLLKIIIVGDASTGKSSILKKFIENRFERTNTHTIGVEFGSKIIEINNQKIKLQIWDTAGQERFRSVTRSYYRGAHGVFVVFDISNRETFSHIPSWLNDIRSLTRPETHVVLIGNKSDLDKNREVTYIEAKKFAAQNELSYFESSAASGLNIDEMFRECVKNALKNEATRNETDVSRFNSTGRIATNIPTNNCTC